MNEATPTSDQPDDPVTGVAAEAKPDAADGQSVEASAEGSDAGGARTDSKQGEGAHEPAPAADSNPSLKQVLTDPVLFLAFGFGSGLAPKGPGTAGTLVALLLFPLLAIMPMSAYLGFLVLVTGIGILVCGAAAKKLGVHDHGGIVWDEFAGFWLAMIGSPASIPIDSLAYPRLCPVSTV